MDHDAEDEPAGPSHWSRDEWLLMFMQGVPIARIATVCRVPLRNVSAFIYGRLKAEPWRRGHRLMIHDHPSLPTKAVRQPRWGERCERLCTFYNEHGRLPSFQSSDPVEKSLISWVYGQRRKYRFGELTKEQLAQLNAVPGWNRPPKAKIEEDRWRQRLVETRAFRERYGRRPRYKDGQSTAERVIAVWLDLQRQKLKVGTLDRERKSALETELPEWQR